MRRMFVVAAALTVALTGTAQAAIPSPAVHIVNTTSDGFGVTANSPRPWRVGLCSSSAAAIVDLPGDLPDDPHEQPSVTLLFNVTHGPASNLYADARFVWGGGVRYVGDPFGSGVITLVSVDRVDAGCNFVRHFTTFTHPWRATRHVRSGIQSISRTQRRLGPGGNCNYLRNGTRLLVTCLFASSTVAYRVTLPPRSRLTRVTVPHSPGIFACHLTTHRVRHGKVLTVYVTIANASGFAQCWLGGLNVAARHQVRIAHPHTVVRRVNDVWTP